MGMTNGRAILISGFLLIASAGRFMAQTARAAAGPTNDGPTKENALEAEKELATGDADQRRRWVLPLTGPGLGDCQWYWRTSTTVSG